MALSKEEQVQLTELAAKAKGMTPEKYIENMAKEYGVEPAVESTTKTRSTRQERGDPNTRFIEKLLESGEKGDLSMDAMFDKLMKFSMMKMMAGGGMFGGVESKKSDEPSAADIIAANDEKWERRNAQEKSDSRFEELQKTNERLERLFLEGGAKKDDPILTELKEQRKELAAEREKRHDEALAAKDDKIADLKEYIDNSLDAIRNQTPPKDPSEAFLEKMQEMSQFDDIVRRRGKALGMTDEQINKEVEAATPMKQQMLKDGVRLLERWIDTQGGKKPGAAAEQPEVAAVTCGNCGKPSTNGTNWCDACRIQYSNDVVRKAQEEADAKARQAGEIPVEEANEPEPTPQA